MNLKCRVFGGKTGPFPMFQVFHVIRPVATVQFRVELSLEPTRDFGPVANTNLKITPTGVSATPPIALNHSFHIHHHTHKIITFKFISEVSQQLPVSVTMSSLNYNL